MDGANLFFFAGIGGGILTIGMVILHIYAGHRKASQ
jgi:hypothetical protein